MFLGRLVSCGFLEGVLGVARRFLKHGHGVITVTRPFTAFLPGHILRIGIATQGLLHTIDTVVELLLAFQQILGGFYGGFLFFVDLIAELGGILLQALGFLG